MKIYVTGASGFIGRRIVDRLLDCGHQPIVLTRDPSRVEPRPAVEVRKCDLTVLETILPAIEDCDAGIHSAGVGPWASERAMHDQNVVATRHLAGAARRFERLTRLVAITSAAVEEPGDTPYRRAKIGQEAALRSVPLKLTILRPTQVLGPWQESEDLKRLVTRLQDTKPFPLIGGGRCRIQPIHVDDVARASVQALERETSIGSQILLAGAEGGLPFEAFVRGISERVHGAAPFRSVPILPLRLAAFGLGILGRADRVAAALAYYGSDHLYSLDLARERLGFEPMSYADALDRAFGPVNPGATAHKS